MSSQGKWKSHEGLSGKATCSKCKGSEAAPTQRELAGVLRTVHTCINTLGIEKGNLSDNLTFN